MANRDYANAAFKADFTNILNAQGNRYMIIDFAVQLFNKLMRWAQPPVQPREFSTSTITVNDRYEKMPGYPMRGIPGTYIRFQAFMDLVYNNCNPLNGFTYNSTNYNYISDQTGLYTAPTFPSNMIASDGHVIAVAVNSIQAWETDWNTLLRPYENALGTIFIGRYQDNLTFPSGAWPYIRHTSITSSGQNVFRLSPGEPDVTLITTLESTGENNKILALAPRGPYIKRLHKSFRETNLQ